MSAPLVATARNASGFFDANAARIASLCHAMAQRFQRGGRLLAFGTSPVARSDVRHVTVEFVHPVIVGKRALPAIGLTPGRTDLVHQMALVARADDIVIGFDDDDEPAVREALMAMRARGCLTIAFADFDAAWAFIPPGRHAAERQEVVETLYHMLWELVHVFFEHPGLLEDAPSGRTTHDAGASGFLYPFLAHEERNLDRIVASVAESVRLKAAEIDALRVATLGRNHRALVGAATMLRERFTAGGTVLTFGNGGSATDAMDAAADYRQPPADTGWVSRSAIDLTEDAAVLTALANDVGVELLFSRQIIALARPHDVAMAFTTSGSSRNILAALAEARRRGLATIAFVGYDGGQILANALADHIVVVPSEYVPRIQEAQATAHHVMRALVEDAEFRFAT